MTRGACYVCAGSVQDDHSLSSEAAEAALLALIRDPPLPCGGRVVRTSRMAVDTFQVAAECGA